MSLSIGVLVLFYEKAAQTLECLRSFLPAGAPIHVLDNGSSPDESRLVRAFVARHPGITLWTSPENLGVAAGRNFLLRRCPAEWLFFVDSDAVVTTPDWPARLASHALGHPDTEVFVPRILDNTEEGYFEWENLDIVNGAVETRRRADESVNRFPGTSIVRRSLFDRLGGFDEAMFVGCEDFEMALRALRAGAPVRGRCVDDIDLVHDHRSAVSAADRRAARVRYDTGTIERSFRHLLEKHGVTWDDDPVGWSRMARGRITGGPLTRLMWKLRHRLKKSLVPYRSPVSARR